MTPPDKGLGFLVFANVYQPASGPPATAPRGMADPNHAASSAPNREQGTPPLPPPLPQSSSRNLGSTGEVQARAVPSDRAPRQAEDGLSGLTYFLSKQLFAAKEYVDCELITR